MMNYAFILYRFGEHGPFNLRGTQERHKLPGLVDSFSDEPKWQREKAKDRLRELAGHTDDELVSLCVAGGDSHHHSHYQGFQLGDGWGSLHLHVIPLI